MDSSGGAIEGLSVRLRAALHTPEVLIPVACIVGFLLWGPHGKPPFNLQGLLGPLAASPLRAAMVDCAWAALVMVALPALAVTFVLHEPLARYGFGAGDVRYGLKAVVIGLAIAAPVAWLTSRSPAMRAVYPFFGYQPGLPPAKFAAWGLVYGLFFLAGEGSMRGLLLFGLRDRVGAAGAVAITAVVQAVWHLGSPTPELLVAPLWGLVAGALILRMRSIWYVWLVHWLANVAIDAFITYGPHLR